MEQVKTLNQTQIVNNPELKINRIKIQIPKRIETSSDMLIGFDPGTVNFGLAVIYPELQQADLWRIKMVRDRDAVERITGIQKVINKCIHFYTHSPKAIIEGASFGSSHRQVELAEIRASLVLWCVTKSIKVKILPPKTIRKEVFGNGNVLAHKEWELSSDIAAALSCAYVAGMGLYGEK